MTATTPASQDINYISFVVIESVGKIREAARPTVWSAVEKGSYQ